MIYSILILLILFLYLFIIKNNNNVYFCNKYDAIKIYNSDEYKNLEKYLQKKEIFYRSNKIIKNGDKNKLKELYISNVYDLNNSDKKIILNLCRISDNILINLLGKTINWRILCINEDFDWGYVHTIDNTIILHKSEIDSWKSKKLQYGLSFMVHEAIHILQKSIMKKHFDKMYESMHYQKYNLIDTLLKNDEIRDNWITNPDGLNGEWIFKTKNKIISLILKLNDKGHHETYYVELDKNYNIKKIDSIKNLNCYIYSKVFQSYHPNEVIGSYIQHLINTNGLGYS